MLKIKQREQGRFVFNETLPQPVNESVGDVIQVGSTQEYLSRREDKVKETQGDLETDPNKPGEWKNKINYKVYKTYRKIYKYK